MFAARIARRGLALLLLALGFALVHANVASAQSAVVVNPPFDVNQVGTPHTVTAQVSGCGFFNPNCAGVLVNFSVIGGGTPSPGGGASFTNGIGQAMFTFTNFTAPTTNLIFASAGPATGVATKQWIAGPPFRIFLNPPNATNPVGTPHTVTARVVDQFNNPVPGTLVTFMVGGTPPGTPAPPFGTDLTDVNGEATFTFTNTTANVTNTITASAGMASATVTKRWIAGPPARLTLSPKTAMNPVDSQHCVMATVTDQFGNPTPGVIVRFSVMGSVNTSGSAATNASGVATFCYTGPALPGADAIHAFADTNNNGSQNPGEPFDDATKTWILPASTPGCEVKITNGGWIVATNGDRASFGGNAQVDADGNVKGEENYRDHGPATPFHLHGNVLSVVCTSMTQATIFGEATIDGSGSHTYRIDVADNGEPGKGSDRYRMRVNTYDSGDQILRGGNVQIHSN